jgi:replication-associated recombination protein RarA
MMLSLPVPLSERMRPVSFDELALPGADTAALKGMVRRGNTMNMMLAGDPGTGKTSTWQILAKGIKADIIELTGASDDIKPNAIGPNGMNNLLGIPLIYVVEETERLSKPMQVSLRGIVEKSFEHCRFIFTTNNIRKIDPGLVSRLKVISYYIFPSDRPRIMDGLLARYEETLANLGVPYDKVRLQEIIATRFPDFRAAANQIEFEMMNHEQKPSP